jgi:hypothetical protein
MRIKLASRKSAAINADYSNSSGYKKMAAVLLPSVIAIRSSVEHAVKAIYEQIFVTLSTLQLLNLIFC